MRRLSIVVMAALLVAGLVPTGVGAEEGVDSGWGHVQELTALEPSGLDGFGRSVVVEGDTLVVGASRADVGGLGDAGAVYVFGRDPADGVWSHVQELTAPEPARNDNFGSPVAIDGDTLIVANRPRKVHVFTRDPASGVWSHAQEFTGRATFGESVAVSGDTLVVGVPGYGYSNDGVVDVFIRDPATGVWSFAQELAAPDPGRFGTSIRMPPWGDFLGRSVAIDGDTIVAGGPGFDDDGGLVEVFTRDPATGVWSHAQEYRGHDNLGWSVAVEGDVVVAGEPGFYDGGEALVFTRDPASGLWSLAQRLTAPNPQRADDFGGSVVVEGDRLAVGASGVDVGGVGNAGAVYVFGRDSATGVWSHVQELTPSSPQDDRYSRVGAMSGDTLAVGASGVDVGGIRSAGVVHVFVEGAPGGVVSGVVSHGDGSPLLGSVEVTLGEMSPDGVVGVRSVCTRFDGSFSLGGFPFDVDLVAAVIGSGRSSRCDNVEFEAGNGWLSQYYNDHNGVRVWDTFRVTEGSPEFTVDFALVQAAPGVAACSGELATIEGTIASDFLAGTSGRDVIVGLGGDDTIIGRGGDDLICAGDGNDTVRGSPGDDTIFGEGGDDLINGGRDDDYIDGGDGADRLFGKPGDDQIRGGGSGDIIRGNPGDDIIWGGAGHDKVNGGFDDDVIAGGPGHDFLAGSSGSDHLSGDGGDDSLRGGPGNDVLYGGPGSDLTHGGRGADTCSAETTINCETLL